MINNNDKAINNNKEINNKVLETYLGPYEIYDGAFLQK